LFSLTRTKIYVDINLAMQDTLKVKIIG